MFAHLLITNDQFDWKFIFVSSGPGQRGAMFIDPVLKGLRGTLLLTVFSMLIGVTLGVVLAIMRLSPNPILRWTAFAYVWFFRAVPRLVLCILFGDLGILWSKVGLGVPFDQQIGALFGIHDLSLKIFSINANDLLTGFVAGMLALGAVRGRVHGRDRPGRHLSRSTRARPRPPRRSDSVAVPRCAGSCCRRRCG